MLKTKQKVQVLFLYFKTLLLDCSFLHNTMEHFRTSRKEWATAGERAEVIRHEDNLHMEGQFEVPETQVVLYFGFFCQ